MNGLSVMTTNSNRFPGHLPRNGRRGGGVSPVRPPDFTRMRRTMIESPLILLYAAAIVTIITVLYWLLGG